MAQAVSCENVATLLALVAGGSPQCKSHLITFKEPSRTEEEQGCLKTEIH